MRLEHSFTVPAPVDEAWNVLLDLHRIAPCMPGATLDEYDGESFNGTVKVKLGPVSLTYRGKGRFVEKDEAARRVRSRRPVRRPGAAVPPLPRSPPVSSRPTMDPVLVSTSRPNYVSPAAPPNSAAA